MLIAASTLGITKWCTLQTIGSGSNPHVTLISTELPKIIGVYSASDSDDPCASGLLGIFFGETAEFLPVQDPVPDPCEGLNSELDAVSVYRTDQTLTHQGLVPSKANTLENCPED